MHTSEGLDAMWVSGRREVGVGEVRGVASAGGVWGWHR